MENNQKLLLLGAGAVFMMLAWPKKKKVTKNPRVKNPRVKNPRASGTAGLMRYYDHGGQVIARWESRGRKYWYELYKDKHGYAYQGDHGGGSFGVNTDGSDLTEAQAMARMQKKIDDARIIDKINMKRVALNPMLLKSMDKMERRAHHERNPFPCVINSRMKNPPINGFQISDSNDKLGPMWNWNLRPGDPVIDGGSCPGATRWCQKYCYAKSGRSVFMFKAYEHNQAETAKPDFADRMIDALKKLGAGNYSYMSTPKKAGGTAKQVKQKKLPKLMRLHAAGDFHTVKYVNDWIKIAKALPDWKFYTYTKSWRPDVQKKYPGMLAALNKLRKLPNFLLLASTDESSEKCPADWREAYAVSDPNVAGELGKYPGPGKGLKCRNLLGEISKKTGKRITCAECKFCFSGNKPIMFQQHGGVFNLRKGVSK